MNRKLLRDAEVDIRKTRPDQGIAVSVAKSTVRRVSKSSRIEPHCVGTMRHAGVPHLIRVQSRASRERWSQSWINPPRNRTLDHRSKRNPAVPLKQRGQAPAPGDLI